MRPNGTVLRGLLPFFCGLLFLIGCTDESSPPCVCPENPAGFGRIAGTVTGGTGPAVASLTIRSVEGQDPGSFLLYTRSDSSGRYEVAVPRGKYRLGVTSPSGGRTFWYHRDGFFLMQVHGEILTVADSTVHADLTLGDVRMTVQLPEEYESHFFDCWLVRRSDGGEVALQSSSGGRNRTLDFTLVPPDSYAVRFDHFVNHSLWWPNTFAPDRAGGFLVRPGREVVLIDTLTLGRVRGHITGAWQEMQAGPPVINLVDMGGSQFAGGNAGADGSFEVPVLGTGRFKAAFQIYPNRAHRWMGGDTEDAAQIYEIGPEGVVDLGTIQDSGILCHLIVSPEWGAEATRGLYVQLDESNMAGRGSGEWLPVPNLKPGSYKLLVGAFSPQVWRPQWFDRLQTEAAATPVVISSPGQVVQVEIRLEEGAKIRGRVLDATGVPVVASLSIEPSCPGLPMRRCCWASASDGTFFLQGLSPGCYRVLAWDGSTGRTTWYPGTANADSAAVINVTGSEEVAGIEWRLRPSAQ